jgi:hypothetical protein
MYLVAIGWLYVVLMMALAEALGPQGSVLGAVITLLMYGLMPLAIVLYIMGTPARRRARRAAEALELAALHQRRQMAAAMRPVTPSRRNEKKAEASATVHAARPATACTPRACSRSRARA